MRPSNMFVVPKSLAGLGELRSVLETVKQNRADLGRTCRRLTAATISDGVPARIADDGLQFLRLSIGALFCPIGDRRIELGFGPRL